MVEENFTVYKPEIFLLAISTISIPTDPHHPVFSRITQPIIRHPQPQICGPRRNEQSEHINSYSNGSGASRLVIQRRVQYAQLDTGQELRT